MPAAPASSSARSSASMASTAAAPRRTAVRRSGADVNASSKWASWARRPTVRPRRRWTSPRSGSSTPAAIRSRVVLPAPFGSHQADPLADGDGRVDRVEDDEGADLAGDVERRTSDIVRRPPPRPPARRVAPARAATPRTVPGRGASRRRVACAPSGPAPLPGPPRRASGPGSPPRQVRPAPPARPRRAGRPRGSPPRPRRSAAGSRWHHEQKWVARWRRRRSAGSAGRSAGTARRCAGTPPGAPACCRRRPAPCSRRSSCRAAATASARTARTSRYRRASSGGRSVAAVRSGWRRARQSASSA